MGGFYLCFDGKISSFMGSRLDGSSMDVSGANLDDHVGNGV